MEIERLDVAEIASAVKQGKISAAETVQAFLTKIEKHNNKFNAVLRINEKALAKAKEMDGRKEKAGNLFGVPVLVKDNFCTKNILSTAASKILSNFNPPYTAYCIEKLEEQGAIVIAKANLDEFAMGSSNENSYYGPCRNPWDDQRVSGGSSGGSAAALAAGFGPLAMGSDTGGSIRQPASFCGVVGVKPTYGSISRYGIVAYASSLDQAGPMAHTVKGTAFALDAMIGKDMRDSTNVERQIPDLKNIQPKNLKSLRVGVLRNHLNSGIQPDIRSQIESVVEELKSQGCQIVDVDIPHAHFAISTYYLIASSEASSNLSRYDGVRFGVRDIQEDSGQAVTDLADFYKLTRSRGFGTEVKRRILLGTFALSAGYFDAYYHKACQVRRLIANDYKEAFAKCDVMLGPTATSTAFKIGEKTQDPIAMYNNDVFTTPVNLAGLPAMSLPIGLDSNSLPIGLQIVSPLFQDHEMLSFAMAVEKLVDFKERPNVQ